MLTPAERQLIVAARRWARAHEWDLHHWRGCINAPYDSDATLTVAAGHGEVRVWRRTPGRSTFPLHSTDYRVASVREAVDVLCALGVLPVWLSSQWQAGLGVGVHLTGADAQAARDRYWTHGCGADVLRKDAELIARRAVPA